MKLIIQIPCLNEEEMLPVTLAELPRKLDGIDSIEWLVIDDGSTDKTVDVAKENGVDHVVIVGRNKGLANAFMLGVDKALSLGADIIVNTDADNQYNGSDIGMLLAPILRQEADYVIGARPIRTIQNFSPLKKFLQWFGSWTVRSLSGVRVPDAPSGFCAISREAAYKLNVFNRYTYTLETLIQAGHSNIRTVSVPIRVNGETRPSRLFGSMRSYVGRSMGTIMRFVMIYRAHTFLLSISIILLTAGVLLGLRFLYFNLLFGDQGHIQSVVLSALLISLGFMTLITAILADLLNINRKLLEGIHSRVRKLEHKSNTIDTNPSKEMD
ncbi:MAG: glycosyltransferase family 2 protein [Rhodospirillaceae bacterium]|jgi:glycosyltransferase involved in cell wall biosynthesis|nr:glycosyltransferase family 2 protein [Rhodospirillaceae bacterium]